jgi:5-methylcytosine-specific restriction endonuclease McrA
MPPKRRWTSSEKREVGFRQEWRCARCAATLPATYEIDHVLALHDGGQDCIETNAEALCNTCHAAKTLRERIEWEKRRAEAIINAKQENAPLTPLRGNEALLDPEPGPDFLENRFLRFAYTRTSRR